MNPPDGALVRFGAAEVEALPRVIRWLAQRQDLHRVNVDDMRRCPEDFWRERLKRLLTLLDHDEAVTEDLAVLAVYWGGRHPDAVSVRRLVEAVQAAVNDCRREAKARLKSVPPLKVVLKDMPTPRVHEYHAHMLHQLMVIEYGNVRWLEWLRNGIYPGFMLVVSQGDLEMVAGIAKDYAEDLALFERFLADWRKGERLRFRHLEQQIRRLKKELAEIRRLVRRTMPMASTRIMLKYL